MVNYTCDVCSKQFNRKSNYDYHIEKKKNPCRKNIPKYSKIFKIIPNYSKNTNIDLDNDVDIDIKNNNIICEYCNKNFSTKFNLNKHLKHNCKKKLDDDKSEENIVLKNKIEIQQKEIEELKRMFYEFSKQNKKEARHNKNINNQTNIQTQNNTQNNNTQNNINIILPHGKELEKIELGEVLDQMITLDFKNMLPNMVKHIYLNADKPENQNFIVNDIARNKCKYFDGEKWLIGKATEKLLGIFENTNSLFVDPFDEPEAIKTVEFIRKNKKYKDKYPTILKCKNYAKSLFNEFDKESIESRQQIIDELKIIFYNHREEILKITI